MYILSLLLFFSSQVISYIILEEAEHKLIDAISSKEKVCHYKLCNVMQCMLCCVLIIGSNGIETRTIKDESIDRT